MTTVAIAHPAAEQAERLVAEVRDDPAARIRFASDAYAGSAALIGLENPLGRLLDYAVIGPRVDALYASAADAFAEPRLRGLVRNGAPLYVWPYERRQVWRRPRAHCLTSLAGALIRPQPSRVTT
jgi:hypothetical protein